MTARCNHNTQGCNFGILAMTKQLQSLQLHALAQQCGHVAGQPPVLRDKNDYILEHGNKKIFLMQLDSLQLHILH